MKEKLGGGFLGKNSFLHFAFFLRVDGLLVILILVGRDSFPSLMSKEKVKVEPMVMES